VVGVNSEGLRRSAERRLRRSVERSGMMRGDRRRECARECGRLIGGLGLDQRLHKMEAGHWRNAIEWFLGNPLPEYGADQPPAYVGGWGLDGTQPTPEVQAEWDRLQGIQDAQQWAIDKEERIIDERLEPGQDHPSDEVVEEWSQVAGPSS